MSSGLRVTLINWQAAYLRVCVAFQAFEMTPEGGCDAGKWGNLGDIGPVGPRAGPAALHGARVPDSRIPRLPVSDRLFLRAAARDPESSRIR